MKTLRKAECCWTCKHSMFDRQSGASGSRYRGTCMEPLDRSIPWPMTWVPPTAFFEVWLVDDAIRYFGEAVVMEIGTDSELFADMHRIRQEHAWMVEMHKRWQEMQRVSFTDVCDLYKAR